MTICDCLCVVFVIGEQAVDLPYAEKEWSVASWMPAASVVSEVPDPTDFSMTGEDAARIWFERGLAGGDIIDGVYYDEKSCYQQALFYQPDYSRAWVQLGYRGGGVVNGVVCGEKTCYETALLHKPDDGMV